MINRGAETISTPPVGKRVGGALYLHRSAIGELAEEDFSLVRAVKPHIPVGYVWSVVKVNVRKRSLVSFLDYEDFEQAAFPALKRSCTIDVASGSTIVRKYSSKNPPILHRKELLLNVGDPRRIQFGALTERLERLGLFRNMNRMGYRQKWEEALRAAGLDEDGHALS